MRQVRHLVIVSMAIALVLTACDSPTDARVPTTFSGDPTATPSGAGGSPTPVIDDHSHGADEPEKLPGLADNLPSIDQVSSIMEMTLAEEEVYADLSQAFEHTDTGHLTEYVTATYRGTMEEGAIGIDLAEYATTEAASEVYEQIAEMARELTDGGEEISLEAMDGAEAVAGVVAPPSEGNSFTVTGIVLQSDRVIAFITVLSHEEGGRQEQAQDLASVLVHELNLRAASDNQAAVQLTPTLAESDHDFLIVDIDPATLCFDVAVLPDSFVLDGQWRDVEDALAALGSPDEARREREYERWGRLSGSSSLWTFSSPASVTKEEEHTLPAPTVEARWAQEEQDQRAMIYFAASCRIDLYAHTEGAQEAFSRELAEIVEDPTTWLGAPGWREFEVVSNIPLGDESSLIVIEGPPPGTLMLVVRARLHNVTSQVVVYARCGLEGYPDCQAARQTSQTHALRLANLVAESIVEQRVPVQ